MQMCSRCQKRIAVVFISRMDPKNGETVNEGLCIQCARELGIKPVNDILEKMGISPEDFDRMTDDLNTAMESMAGDSQDLGEDAGAPAVEFPTFLSQFGMNFPKRGNRDGETQETDKDEEKKQEKPEKKKKPDPRRKTLDTFCTNLTKRAAEGKLDRIVGREHELERVIQILCRRQKNNPCLIGEPGVGKTAIAEALAMRIAEGNVPEKLKDHEVYLVDLTALVAGTQFRGQFESRVLGLLNEVKALGNIILVIDEVHNIVGAGDAEGSMNAANMMKPALSRGEIQVIGATTMKEYRKYIEKDSALERRFQPVIVNEPTTQETVEMLRGTKKYYEDYHGILIPDHVLAAAVRLSERYIQDRFLPDKAIDLLDEAASHVSLSSPAVNERIRLKREYGEMQKQLTDLEAKSDTIEEDAKETYYQEVASLKVEISQKEERLAELDKTCASLAVTVADLADVVEIWTGIPATDIKEQEFEQLDKLEDRIKTRIVGQEEAVSAVVRAIRRKRAGVSVHKSPISMIFAGPTGVGKTELVKVLASDLFKQPDMLIRLDMSEYMEKHSVSRLIGAPPGYVGYDEAGQLTEKIRRRPYSVILFDEIEKAHPDVMNILLQILDDGRVTDAAGRVVNFENTVIVMTTNAGSDKGSAVSGFSETQLQQDKDRTERALLDFLRPEFLNRVDEVITFHPLTHENFREIAAIMLGDLRDALATKGIEFSYSDGALDIIAKESYSEKYGARNMRRYIETHVEDALASAIISHYQVQIKKATLDAVDGKLQVICL
ncbi:MAG: ATP-dependent Clp protease ATP-binding subunit [Clostridia bacterium]|nr:ATP-dependent Clp protease ATP-binding subunit [Clostridia bacterium]MDY6184964.1 ATP-dependent Clp protease ATP-binding subunit [Eubacteriales bacterium]